MPGAPKEPEATTASLSCDRLCDELSALADHQNFRTAEALASTLVNRVRRGFYPSPEPGSVNASPCMHETLSDRRGHMATLQRIARRALSGSLRDPTAGATDFHRIEVTPDWARDRLPVAVFGSYLFYRC